MENHRKRCAMKIKLLLPLFILFFNGNFIYSQGNTYSVSNISDELKKNANAVIRLNDIQIVIESQRKIKTSLHRVVTVLNEKGDRYLNAGVGFDNYIKVKSIQAIVFDEFGEEIKKIKKKDFIDHSAVDGGTLYSDSRVLFMAYTPIKYPYTVSFTCEIESVSTALTPMWRPINDYYVSIEKDTYILTDFANLGLRFKEKNFDDYNIVSNTTNSSLSYAISNVPSLKPEDLSPSFSKITPQVMVATEKFHYNGVDGQAKDWMEFGAWIKNSLLDGRNEVTVKTKQAILSLVEGIDDPLEKAKKIYEFVQENTRYISVQVGIGGIQPIAAIEVDKVKYGDCKGLTNYTQSLLEIAGITSYYSVVESGREIVDFDTDFASLAQGDHIILGIPSEDKMIWLDCTSQVHPFGFIGSFTDNRNVLAIKGDTGEIIKTTVYPDKDNYQLTIAEVELNPDASIASDVSIKTKGIQYDKRFGIERESKKNVIEYYKEYWSNVNNLEVLDYTFENNKEIVEFTETIKLYASNYASSSGDKLIFAPNTFNKNSFVPNRYRNRRLPVEIQRGYLDEDVFIYKIPMDFEVESIPDNIQIKNKFGEYSAEYIVRDSEIQYKRKLLISKGDFPKSDYDSYRNFRKKIASNDNSKIILKKTSNHD